MSWHYLQEGGGEFSLENYLDGIASELLKSKNTQQTSCLRVNAMASSENSQSGMMSEPLMASRGADLSMSCPAVSRAKTSARREKARALTESAAGYGAKCTEYFAKYDPNSRSWKTRQCSLLAGLDEFSETWPQSGLMLHGHACQRKIAARRIAATEYGYLRETWLTPTATDGARSLLKMESLARHWMKHPGSNLAEQVAIREMLPTPTVADNKFAYLMSREQLERRREHHQFSLAHYVQEEDLKQHPEKILSGALNPAFVEWLMGWPAGWTDLSHSAMDKYQSWLEQHFRYCTKN